MQAADWLAGTTWMQIAPWAVAYATSRSLSGATAQPLHEMIHVSSHSSILSTARRTPNDARNVPFLLKCSTWPVGHVIKHVHLVAFIHAAHHMCSFTNKQTAILQKLFSWFVGILMQLHNVPPNVLDCCVDCCSLACHQPRYTCSPVTLVAYKSPGGSLTRHVWHCRQPLWCL